MNAIDHEDSNRLAWLDFQLEVIAMFTPTTQAALAHHVARIRAERRAILLTQPTEQRHEILHSHQ